MIIKTGLPNVLIFSTLLAMNCQTKMAYAENKPIITLSYGTPYLACGVKCEPSFIIKIFEDGLVQYKGVKNVEVLGRDEHRIDKSTLEKLINKFEKAHFIDATGPADPAWIPINATDRTAWISAGIRFRQGTQEMTTFRRQCELVNEIIRTTDAERLWDLEWIRMSYCR